MELLLGLITGIIFGFILQKGRVLRFEKQVGFLRLKDMTILKFMFSAILTGMVGIYLFKDMGLIELKVKSLSMGAQVVGGLAFGIGWAIFGYCPGTAIGALGEGRIHVLWGILGMLLGAGLYAELYPTLKATVLTWGSFGNVTLPELLSVNHWIIIVIFIGAGLGLFRWIERKIL